MLRLVGSRAARVLQRQQRLSCVACFTSVNVARTCNASSAVCLSSAVLPAVASVEDVPVAQAPIVDSEDSEALRYGIRRFAEEVVKPHVPEMDTKGIMRQDVLTGLFDQGYMAMEIPTEYGGSGMDFSQTLIVIEELARVDPGVSVLCDVQNTLVISLFMRYASKALKDAWLPQLASGTVGAFCLSEESSGSDAFALKATAVPDGNGGFILNGTKAWITNAAEAGVFLVMANVDPSKKHRGITCFVVPRDTPGLTIGKKEDKLGIRSSSTCPVILDNVRIPESSVVGDVGKGYKYAIATLNEGRIGIGAQMLGLAQGVFDITLPYMYQRKQFGQTIGSFQGMGFQLAEAAMELEAARLLVYNAARLRDAGLPFTIEAAMAKLKASKVADMVTSRCVEWCGGVGFTREFPQEKFYRDVKIGAIYEGTSNIQLQTIAKDLEKKYGSA